MYEAKSNAENACVSQYWGVSDIIYSGEIASLFVESILLVNVLVPLTW